MKKLIATVLSLLMILSLAACGSQGASDSSTADDGGETGTTYTVGICNYVDDASLNQIVENIRTRLDEMGD